MVSAGQVSHQGAQRVPPVQQSCSKTDLPLGWAATRLSQPVTHTLRVRVGRPTRSVRHRNKAGCSHRGAVCLRRIKENLSNPRTCSSLGMHGMDPTRRTHLFEPSFTIKTARGRAWAWPRCTTSRLPMEALCMLPLSRERHSYQCLIAAPARCRSVRERR